MTQQMYKRQQEAQSALRGPDDFKAFIGGTDWAGGAVAPLRADASVRRFFRVSKDGRTAILMDARPPLDDTRAFELVQRKFARIGLTVPEIYAADHAEGLILMEDFGDTRLFELVTHKTGDLDKIYALATDVLVHKFFADPKMALEQSVAYSDDYWLFRVEQFLQHYMPHVVGRTVSETAQAEFLGLYRELITAAHKFPDVLLHGDFVVQNLYHLPERPGVKALGLIDFQDLTDARGNMMGSPAFDLAFLLQDVRVELPEGLEERMKRRFIEKSGIKNVADFEIEYATIAAAQATKCLGLFARLGYGEGRKEYLQFIPYCWRNLEQSFRHPALGKIKNWFEKNNINRDTRS